MADVMNAVVGAVGAVGGGNRSGENAERERKWSQYKGADGGDLPSVTLQNLTYFQRKHGTDGTIDVWWLYDDGG